MNNPLWTHVRIAFRYIPRKRTAGEWGIHNVQSDEAPTLQNGQASLHFHQQGTSITSSHYVPGTGLGALDLSLLYHFIVFNQSLPLLLFHIKAVTTSETCFFPDHQSSCSTRTMPAAAKASTNHEAYENKIKQKMLF